MNSSQKSADPPLAAEGGVRPPIVHEDSDPYRALDNLMAVVEALCPTWPPRRLFPPDARLLM